MNEDPNTLSQPVKSRSSLNLLLILFVCFIILSLAVVSYYQRERHQADQVPELIEQSELTDGYNTIDIRIGGESFVADVANTDELRQLGLSGRKTLGDNQAMIFIFPANGRNLFWMKDMNFAIDIIWLDENKKIVYMEKGIKPESYPKTFGPATQTRYVIEFKAGVADRIGLQVGDIASF